MAMSFLKRMLALCTLSLSLSFSLSHSQVQAWWFLTFTALEIKNSIQYLTGVQYLFDTINPDQIDIPQFILDHDVEVNSHTHTHTHTHTHKHTRIHTHTH